MEAVLGVVSAVSLLANVWFAWRGVRREDSEAVRQAQEAEVSEAEKLTRAAIDLLAPYRMEVAGLRTAVGVLEGRVRELEGMVAERDERVRHLEELVAALQE